MLTVKIISGTYGYRDGKRLVPKDRTSEPFELENAEAERLVALGVAEIITESVATGGNGEETNPPNVNPSDDENGVNGENEGENNVVGHLDAEQLQQMTIKELKALAEDMGIDTAKFKVKDEYVQAIVAVEVTAPADDENGDDLPDLSAEDPEI